MKSLFVILALVAVASAAKPMKSAWDFPGFDVNDRLALLRNLIEEHRSAGVLRKPGANNASSETDHMGACWKDTISRESHAPDYCPPGQEHYLAHCYDECKPGYTAAADGGPFCWENCREAYVDSLGGLCNRDMLTVSANTSACPFYDKCGLISDKDCGFCPPSPPGYPPFRRDGCQCRTNPDYYTKDVYAREAHLPTCAPDEVFESGFCLDICPKKYNAVGPICVQECPKSRPHDAGVLCCKDEKSCDQFIANMAKASVQLVAAAVEHGFDIVETEDLIQQMIQTASTFAFFKCTKYTVGK